jgi:hypothetical protein
VDFPTTRPKLPWNCPGSLSSAEVSVLSKKAGNLCQKSRPIVQNTGGTE